MINYLKFNFLLLAMCAGCCTLGFATELSPVNHLETLTVQEQPGFFRISFDNVKMPQNIQNMGLLGITYNTRFTPYFYSGLGGYGSVTGTQGGLFVLGVNVGLQKQLLNNWWGDASLFAGGGGGKSSLVGGGLMVEPRIALMYDYKGVKVGLHYSYIDFPSGDIKSKQFGLDVDIPCNIYYLPSVAQSSIPISSAELTLPLKKYLTLQRNDFAIIMQFYRQQSGTKNINDVVQDDTIDLVGAEIDHYITDNGFWWIQFSGAYHGIPNGYMDVLGGLGYHFSLKYSGFALIPQLGVGAGGGGNVNTGGGTLVQPQLGFEWPFTTRLSGRVSGGYLWAPSGTLKATTITGALVYHLNIGSLNSEIHPTLLDTLTINGWRIQLFNQTYLHPQRSYPSSRSPANLLAVQFDQLITPLFFMSYQAAAAYSGSHMGGYATGMIGPGVQTPPLLHLPLQLFSEVLVGAGGGGNLALGGGALIEPMIGMQYQLTPPLGIQTSVSQIKALRNSLNTLAINIGFNLNFSLLETN